MPKQRGTTKLSQFKVDDRFWINHRAYKRTETFQVITVDADRIRFIDIREIKHNTNPDGWQIGTFNQQHLDAYAGCIMRVKNGEDIQDDKSELLRRRSN